MILVLMLLGAWSAALVTPAAAGGGCHDAAFEDTATNEVTARGACFNPVVARVEVGDTVTWRGDASAHTVSGASGIFDAGELHPDGTATQTFDTAGVYPYVCYLHVGMVGAIVVGEADSAAAPASVSASSDGRTAPAAAMVLGVALGLAALLAAVFAWAVPRRHQSA